MAKWGTLAAPTGEVGCIRRPYNENSRIFLICLALPVSGIKIGPPIVFAQRKGHKRIGEAWKRFHHASQNSTFKGIVQRKLTGVKNKLMR